MIKITHNTERDGTECRHTITIKGHAGYAPIGEDIVCAGVSTLAYTLIARLEDLKAWEFKHKDSKTDGMTISCVTTDHDEDIKEAIRFAMQGFTLLQDHYHKKYVQVTEKG